MGVKYNEYEMHRAYRNHSGNITFRLSYLTGMFPDSVRCVTVYDLVTNMGNQHVDALVELWQAMHSDDKEALTVWKLTYGNS